MIYLLDFSFRFGQYSRKLKLSIFLLLAFGMADLQGQVLTGSQLLDKTIAHHDPNNNWGTFDDQLAITMKTPDKKERISRIRINLPERYFKLSATKDGVTLEHTLDKDVCTLSLNGSTEISEEDAETHRLTCERANSMKNYYTYLYGLPMKLKDPGTIVDPKVQTRTFKGKKYLVLKVNYDDAVGNDSWYFYFDPQTYAMEVYQFFHDETKNDGEYILLSGTETISGILMPKTRAWYYNKDHKYLGTDVLKPVASE